MEANQLIETKEEKVPLLSVFIQIGKSSRAEIVDGKEVFVCGNGRGGGRKHLNQML
jgi:glycyl-tRNA synthetase (class II)